MPIKTNPAMTDVIKEMLTDQTGPFYSYILCLINQLEKKNKELEAECMAWKTYDPDNVAYIHAWGPEATQNKHGDEIPVYYLARCDADENEILCTPYFSRDEVATAAIKLAERLEVELINEISWE